MEKKAAPLGIRVSQEERERLDALVAIVRLQYPQMNMSDVLRELIGFTSTGIISPRMRVSLLPLQDTDRKPLPPATDVSEPRGYLNVDEKGKTHAEAGLAEIGSDENPDELEQRDIADARKHRKRDTEGE